MSDFIFRPWKRSKLHTMTKPESGRRRGGIEFEVNVNSLPPDRATANFLLMGPRDIAQVNPNAIARLAPAPNDQAAETTKLVHVDFVDADFPWRYTLADVMQNEHCQPWLVLIVGTEDELRVDAGQVHILNEAVLTDISLDQSQWWAHWQSADGRETGRLICPRELRAHSSYIAALVPAYNDAGGKAWPPVPADKKLRALFSWRFRTTSAGDFESLAAALTVRSKTLFPKVKVNYRLRNGNVASFGMYGAIKPQSTDGETPAEAADLTAIRADLGPMVTPNEPASTPPVLGLPLYGRHWTADPAATVWGKQLFDDPRPRSQAGIGMQMAIEAQDELLEAAVGQAGALAALRNRVRSLVAGHQAKSSLWRRRLPDDPLARLWVFGPALARIPVITRDPITGTVQPGGSLLHEVTNARGPLKAAIFSSAARRVLRRGSAATRFLGSQTTRSDILNAANTCPAPRDESDEVNRTRDELREQFDMQVPRIERPMDSCTPPDLVACSKCAESALEPNLPEEAQVPPTLPIVLDFPTWLLLKKHARQWLLPGVDKLPTDSVVCLSTNVPFIEAYLMGINTQFKNELHWRQLADTPEHTTFRLFWGAELKNSNPNLVKRVPDIKQISTWSNKPLGDPGHQEVLPGDVEANRDLVVVFRTELFRRYPTTQVYLRKIPEPAADAAVEAALKVTPVGPDDKFPIFQGTIDDDIPFFIFDLAPADQPKYWIMLEEPPADLRFKVLYSAVPGQTPVRVPPSGNSASWAKSLLDHPTRVAITMNLNQ